MPHSLPDGQGGWSLGQRAGGPFHRRGAARCPSCTTFPLPPPWPPAICPPRSGPTKPGPVHTRRGHSPCPQGLTPPPARQARLSEQTGFFCSGDLQGIQSRSGRWLPFIEQLFSVKCRAQSAWHALSYRCHGNPRKYMVILPPFFREGRESLRSATGLRSHG